MAVNKVEYKLASTTEGFAQAGDIVQIKLSNAKTIQKDVDEGCTEDLSNATQRFLDIRVQHSTEETDYEGDDDGEGGEDEMGEDGEQSQEKSGSSTNKGAIAGLMFGQAALMATTALHFPVMNAFTAPVVGMVDLQLGATSIAMAQIFDSQFNSRMSEAAASGDYISELQEYEEIMNTDIETMTAAMEELEATESEGENAEAGEEPEATDGAGELEALKAELEKAQAEGDEEKVAEIQAKIDEITAALAEGSEDAEDPMEEILMNNESAHMAEDISKNTAEFLHEGNQLGQMGVMNAVQLAGCATNSVFLAAEAYIGVNPFLPFTFVNAAVGQALSLAAAGTFKAATTMMTVKSVKEFQAASKGSDISGELANIKDPLQQHDELVETLIAKKEETSNEEGGSGDGDDNGGDGSGGGAPAPAPTTSSTPTSGGSSPSGGSSGGGSSPSA